MNATARPLALVLASCLVLSSPGCQTSFEEAVEVRECLKLGMTQDEVRDELGDPGVIITGEGGGTDTWAYICTGGPGVVGTIFLVLLALPLLPLILLTGGAIAKSGAADEQPYFIILRFDASGRVASISNPELQAAP